MDGILSASGIQAWVGGNKKLVREWDRCVVDTVEDNDIVLFANSAEGKVVPSGKAAITKKETILDTSMKKEGRFAHDNWTATHLALELQSATVVDTTPGNDLVAGVITDINRLIGRLWFEMFFTSSNEPHDRGQYTDFPSGRGLIVHTSTAAETVVTRSVCNGLPGEAGLKTMRTPYVCTPETTPRLVISRPSGILGNAADWGLYAFVLGFEG